MGHKSRKFMILNQPSESLLLLNNNKESVREFILDTSIEQTSNSTSRLEEAKTNLSLLMSLRKNINSNTNLINNEQ